MKKQLIVLTLGLAFSVLSFAENLQVGFAQKDITPVQGVPVGGLGGGGRRFAFPTPFSLFKNYFFFKPSEGTRDPIRAKVMLVQNGDEKLLFISLDIIGVMREIYTDLLSRLKPLGFSEKEVFISATHTHSGPGAIVNNMFWSVAIMDVYRKKVYKPFAEGIIQAVKEAQQNLTEADLYSTSFAAQDLQSNRRNKPGHFDPQANFLYARDKSGFYLGAMVNLPVHGTALDGKNLKFSADVPGSYERALESKLSGMNSLSPRATQPTVLFVNGAEGDVSPIHGGEEALNTQGELFANQALASLQFSRKIQPEWSVHMMDAPLGRPGLYIKECFNSDWSKYIYRHFYIGLGFSLRKSQPLMALKFDDMMMMSVPGEATTTIGLSMKEMAEKIGAKQSWVLGLTNGYVAYFTTPEEFDEGTYESCNSLFGRYGGQRVLGHVETLLKKF